MSPKIIDEVQDWLRGLRGKSSSSDQPVKAVYNGKEVWIYSQTADYIIVAYNDKGEKMFSIKPQELK